MEKSYLAFFLLTGVTILFFFVAMPARVNAQSLCTDPTTGQSAPCCIDPDTGTTDVHDFITSASGGFVPCGISTTTDLNGVSSLTCPCQLGHLFIVINKLYNFILWYIATPLAGLLIMIGGIIIIFSAGFPNWRKRGENIIWWTVIAWALMFGAYIIVSVLFAAIGYTPVTPWNSF